MTASAPFKLRAAAAAPVESRSAAMLEAALDCIVTMDAEGRVVDFNAAAERTFGYDRAEVRGRSLSELIIPPRLRGGHEARLAHHLSTGESAILGRRLELPAMRSDGSEIPVELTVARTDVGGVPLFIGFVRDLSDIHAAQAAAREAEERFRRLVEQVPTVTYICDYDVEISVRYMSPQIERWTGYPAERWVEDPQFWRAVVHPGDRAWVFAAMASATRAEVPIDLEYRLLAADGSVVRVWDQETIIRGEDGVPLSSQGVMVNMTELRATEAALELSERRLGAIVESAPMILFAMDAGGVFTFAEGQALSGLGLTSGEVVGRSLLELYGHLPEVRNALRRALAGETISEVLAVGDMVFDVAASTVTHADGPVVIGVATDVTARHASERQLEHDARHDRLTGLANRAALQDCLTAAVERARTGGKAVALLNLDLDDFKTVNDSLGHGVGDGLLCAIAARLAQRVGEADVLARQGGDEFMLLLEDLPGDGRAAAEAVAAELLEELRCVFRVGGAELQIGRASASASTRPTPPAQWTSSVTRTSRPIRPSAASAGGTPSTARPTTAPTAGWS